jgi:uncharacterized protein
MKDLEIRSYKVEELKSDAETKRIQGRAVVYNSMSKPLKTASGNDFTEIITRGAAKDSIDNDEIFALMQHDMQKLLGRKSNGTLKIEDREDGIYVDIQLPDTGYARDLISLVARQDIREFSFGFIPLKQKVYSRGDQRIRELTSIQIKEFSLVANPAYNNTFASLRDEDFIEDKVEKKDDTSIDNANDLSIYNMKQKLYEQSTK